MAGESTVNWGGAGGWAAKECRACSLHPYVRSVAVLVAGGTVTPDMVVVDEIRGGR